MLPLEIRYTGGVKIVCVSSGEDNQVYCVVLPARFSRPVVCIATDG